MNQEKLYVLPIDKVVIPQSTLHEIFLDDDVSAAYSSFKKKGYVRKLKKLIDTIVISEVPTTKESLSEDIITTFIVKRAVEYALFTEGEGDIKKALVYLLEKSLWLKEIDNEYEIVLQLEKEARETLNEQESSGKQNSQNSTHKPTSH